MANSTFSWWGARFGEELRSKFILRPAPWLTINDAIDPCPKRWISVAGSVESGIGVNPVIVDEFYSMLQSLKF